jgi:hypothetical protein
MIDRSVPAEKKTTPLALLSSPENQQRFVRQRSESYDFHPPGFGALISARYVVKAIHSFSGRGLGRP